MAFAEIVSRAAPSSEVSSEYKWKGSILSSPLSPAMICGCIFSSVICCDYILLECFLYTNHF